MKRYLQLLMNKCGKVQNEPNVMSSGVGIQPGDQPNGVAVVNIGAVRINAKEAPLHSSGASSPWRNLSACLLKRVTPFAASRISRGGSMSTKLLSTDIPDNHSRCRFGLRMVHRLSLPIRHARSVLASLGLPHVYTCEHCRKLVKVDTLKSDPIVPITPSEEQE